ncbi:DUF3450 family protein [Pseudoalteromonas luteoviolacea]|uniref:DUF3450 family protein n=2 Tax=Pseudoalteromonas luteoviolacea TaxID=43657 RepID=A0A0F6AE24_9GAMM|nr:DUF3450 family protein [Pseudoalteromonas luteoviolacea]AOT07989.1 hypothetical protein S4054249_09090 [Pseudoalteromonas luteoviolacea]AOT12905.1 hypothetical protein S40542_09090 [Pseudoalteromonas luteoviolacea]AOT17818.1 hypothetical protein S4054_09085 [Pseudoalteromonas luteoviolacea]KKE84462.1 hypothetical protein N479_09480 [Pseudoalteromonas luteoviolacea S4054]KZN71837.1 hypothetical protein N481_18020 [Pseudoalteromonas luteoviolacea S4047-1]
MLLFSTCSVQAMDETQLIEQWLNLEKQKSALTTSWMQRKTHLQQKSLLLSKEQTALQKLISNSNKNQSLVSEKRAKLTSQQFTFEHANAELTHQLDLLSKHLKSVITKLPPPLQQQWKKTLSRLDTESNSIRLEVALNLIKQAYNFDKRVVFHTGLIELNEHESILAEQVYLGLAHGWYISKDKHYFGYGQNQDNKFQWQHKDQVNIPLTQAHISQVTYILTNPMRAKYVQLPLAINSRSSGAL